MMTDTQREPKFKPGQHVRVRKDHDTPYAGEVGEVREVDTRPDGSFYYGLYLNRMGMISAGHLKEYDEDELELT